MDSKTKEDEEYSKVLETVKSLIIEAGKIVKEAFVQREKILSSIEIKDNNTSNIVTETDKKVENLLKQKLKESFPSYKFIGEETTNSIEGHKVNLTDSPTWVIDPLDGTTNFVHGIPFICISIGLVVKKVPVIGVIYNPILNNLFWAQRGYGSYLDGKKLPLYKNIPLGSLKKCLIITEYGYHRESETVDKVLESIRNLVLSQAHGIRSFGSAALNMCQVAQGSGDLYYELGMHAWDVAAGTIIVKEAGGIVVGYRKDEALGEEVDIVDEPFDIVKRHVLCIRYTPEGKDAQGKLLKEVREKIIDFPIEYD